MREVLVSFGMIFGLVAALFGPAYWSLWVYWWIAFFRPQDWAYSDLLSPLYYSGTIWAIVIIKGFVQGRVGNCFEYFCFCVVGVLIGGGLAHFESFNSVVSWESLLQFAVLSCILMLSLALIDQLEVLDQSIKLIVAFVLFHTARAGLGIILSGSGSIGEGLGGYMPDNNSFGLLAAILMPLIYACGKSFQIDNSQKSSVIAWLTFGLMFLNGAAVIFTGSRGAFLALSVSIFLMLCFAKKKLISIFLVLIAVVFFISTETIVSSEYKSRIESISDYQRDDGDASILSRLHFWNVAVDIIQDHPFGVGFRNFGFAYDKYDSTNGLYGLSRPVHNSHLQILTEGGWIAFVAWICVILITLKKLFMIWVCSIDFSDSISKRYNIYSSALISSISSFVIGSSFGNYAYNDLFWTLLALSAILVGLNSKHSGLH